MNLLRVIKRYFSNLESKKITVLVEIAQLIGEYYLDKNLEFEDNYLRAREELRALGITQIEFKKGDIIITLARPGLLIGRHGDNLNALEKFLGLKMKYKKLQVKEDSITCWLYPYVPDDRLPED